MLGNRLRFRVWLTMVFLLLVHLIITTWSLNIHPSIMFPTFTNVQMSEKGLFAKVGMVDGIGDSLDLADVVHPASSRHQLILLKYMLDESHHQNISKYVLLKNPNTVLPITIVVADIP